MSEDRLETLAQTISTGIETQMRIKGRSLEHQVYKVGRQFPKSVRKDAQVVLKALETIGNPKLLRMVDMAAVEKSAANVIAHLQTIDPVDRLKGRILNWLGAISAFGIVVFVVLIWVAVKRGLI